MTKKSLLLPAAMLAMAAPGVLFAQETATTDYGIKFGGFVKIDAFGDDHTVVGARQDMFLLYPAKRAQITGVPTVPAVTCVPNNTFTACNPGTGTASSALLTDPNAVTAYIYGNNTDLNKRGQTVFTGVQTRLAGKITAPDAFGAKVTGLIEADFFGYPADANIASLGLRHAWINLDWGSTAVRVGQDWHPLFTAGGVTPNTIQFNPIAPIHPFGRAPQVALTQKAGDLKVSLYALEQSYHVDLDTTSAGSSKPLSNARIPELAAQIAYDANGITIGGTADVKTLRPRDDAQPDYLNKSIANTQVGNNENTVKSTAFQLFAKVKMGDATFKVSTTTGSNLTSTTGRWGYALKRDYALESITAMGGSTADQNLAQALTKKEYAAIKSQGYWAEFDYGKDVEFGIVGGTILNLGAASPIDTTRTYNTANGGDLRRVTTVAPHVKFTSGKTWVALEYIYSAAQYAEDDKGYQAAMRYALAQGGLTYTAAGATSSDPSSMLVSGVRLDNPAVRNDHGRITNFYTVTDHRVQVSVNQSF